MMEVVMIILQSRDRPGGVKTRLGLRYKVGLTETTGSVC